eukprot:gnl/TRDRNA2_/TRDRNA2_152208_c0_seq1.p1 gnl/TRDRNA2_/TRDRNA2_152208_c0~~gnl/TRDRNA2_/TRDRNA2_152208_c0_seq1.p1  ORF type:complete len:950 (-),score=117.05 gnl/TRDRNA2_/TRDRNA2_152208_c0_seq1:90-2597(-)
MDSEAEAQSVFGHARTDAAVRRKPSRSNLDLPSQQVVPEPVLEFKLVEPRAARRRSMEPQKTRSDSGGRMSVASQVTDAGRKSLQPDGGGRSPGAGGSRISSRGSLGSLTPRLSSGNLAIPTKQLGNPDLADAQALRVEQRRSTTVQKKINQEGYAEGVVYTERYADGSVYVGTFRQNCREGDGKLTYANGDIYDGQFVGDMRHHRGQMIYATGDHYSGDFLRDELDGTGSLVCKDGWRYEGQFHKSMVHGEGRIEYMQIRFPAELLNSGGLWGPSRPAPEASADPGSVHELLTATRHRGRFRGQFRGGRRHGHGRVEFEAQGEQGARVLEPHFLEGEWVDDMRQGFGISHVENYMRYEGQLHRDEADGQGKLKRWFQGGEFDTFEGQFKHSAIHGAGVYTCSDGTVYTGEFEEGRRHGKGRVEVRGASYEGEFCRGLRHGHGKYESPAASYDGHYLNGERHGFGKLRETVGGAEGSRLESVYEGEFVGSLKHGEGSLRSADVAYDGSWQRSLRHGRGRQVCMRTGSVYVGTWAGDAMHGEGELMTASIRYVGQFHNGEQCGTGVQEWRASNGDRFEGEFKNSRPHGTGTFTFASRGETYEGQVKDGEFNGEGTYHYAGGGSYCGQWRNGRQDGQGQLRYADGTCYCGEFEDDAFHGHGTYTEPSGTVYTGTFQRDHRCGEGILASPDGQLEVRYYDSCGKEVDRIREFNFAGAVTSTLPEGQAMPLASPVPWSRGSPLPLRRHSKSPHRYASSRSSRSSSKESRRDDSEDGSSPYLRRLGKWDSENLRPVRRAVTKDTSTTRRAGRYDSNMSGRYDSGNVSPLRRANTKDALLR